MQGKILKMRFESTNYLHNQFSNLHYLKAHESLTVFRFYIAKWKKYPCSCNARVNGHNSFCGLMPAYYDGNPIFMANEETDFDNEENCLGCLDQQLWSLESGVYMAIEHECFNLLWDYDPTGIDRSELQRKIYYNEMSGYNLSSMPTTGVNYSPIEIGNKSLLIGDYCLMNDVEKKTSINIFPAFQVSPALEKNKFQKYSAGNIREKYEDKHRCFVVRETKEGFSKDQFIDFDSGIKILVKAGAYQWSFEKGV